jgi:hypothetical protein
VDLTAPPLVPLAVLALASSGQVGGGGAPAGRQAAPAGAFTGETSQERPVSIRVREGGRRAAWRIGYVASCPGEMVIRGHYVSGGGTPLLDIEPDGRFRLSRSEPAAFKPEGTGRARFSISGRLGRDGGSGTWRLTLVTPPVDSGTSTCRVGPIRWRVGSG